MYCKKLYDKCLWAFVGAIVQVTTECATVAYVVDIGCHRLLPFLRSLKILTNQGHNNYTQWRSEIRPITCELPKSSNVKNKKIPILDCNLFSLLALSQNQPEIYYCVKSQPANLFWQIPEQLSCNSQRRFSNKSEQEGSVVETRLVVALYSLSGAVFRNLLK